jgi:hypothetical protein
MSQCAVVKQYQPRHNHTRTNAKQEMPTLQHIKRNRTDVQPFLVLACAEQAASMHLPLKPDRSSKLMISAPAQHTNTKL